MAHNNEAGGLGKAFWELSQEMEEEPHRYEDTAEDTDPDYTTPSGIGDDTTDGAAEDATTDDGGAHTDGSQPKKQRKDRRPNALRTLKEEFTQVDSDGNPTEPKHIVKGYSVSSGAFSGAPSRSTPRTLGIRTEGICATSSSRSCTNDTSSPPNLKTHASQGIK